MAEMLSADSVTNTLLTTHRVDVAELVATLTASTDAESVHIRADLSSHARQVQTNLQHCNMMASRYAACVKLLQLQFTHKDKEPMAKWTSHRETGFKDVLRLRMTYLGHPVL